MTQGMMLFAAGIGMLALAVLLSLVFAFTAKGEKKKIDDRMKERYLYKI